MKKIENNWIKIFLLGLILIVAWKIIDINTVISWIRASFEILTPFIHGAIIAFFTYKPSKHMERFTEKYFPKMKPKLRRTLCVFFVYFLFIIVIIAALQFFIPAIYKNINELVNNLPQYYANIEAQVKHFENSSNVSIISVLSSVLQQHLNFDLIGKFVNIFTAVANSLLNVFLGIILSMYILIERDSLSELFKTLMGFVLKDRKKTTVFLYLGKLVEIFNSYFVGLLLDSMLIGSISVVFFYVFGAPYPLLLGLVVAIGNMIPFFGPIVSAIIVYVATAIVLGPIHAIWVLIFQLIVGQLDGNLLQPKIIGNTVGISPFWVIFAVTFFGGFWGPVGMIIGVPIVASLRLLYYDYKEDGKLGNAYGQNDD